MRFTNVDDILLGEANQTNAFSWKTPVKELEIHISGSIGVSSILILWLLLYESG